MLGAIKEGFPMEVIFGPNLIEKEGFEQRERQPNGNCGKRRCVSKGPEQGEHVENLGGVHTIWNARYFRFRVRRTEEEPG